MKKILLQFKAIPIIIGMLIISCLLPKISKAQTAKSHVVAPIGFCAMHSNVSDILKTIPQNQLRSSSGNYVLRIFVHVMRRSNGTGGQTQQGVDSALSFLVSDFELHNICFSLLGQDEILNDTYYNYSSISNFSTDCNGDGIVEITETDCNGDGKFDNFSVNSHSNAIDVYLFANDKVYGGLQSGIPGTALVLGGNNWGSNFVSSHIVSHEMGHCLGLFHTFHGTATVTSNTCSFTVAGCPELVNGANSSTCGDFVTDTPADPARIYDCQSTCSWTGCTCTGSSIDANGASYNPDPQLIMAYSKPNCMQYHSSGQGSRMLSVIANSTLLQNTLVPYDSVLTALTVTSGQDILYDVENNLTLQTSVSVQSGGKLTLRAGNQIALLPNFQALLGSELQAIINNQCSTIDHNNSAKINIPDRENGKPIDQYVLSTEINH